MMYLRFDEYFRYRTLCEFFLIFAKVLNVDLFKIKIILPINDFKRIGYHAV